MGPDTSTAPTLSNSPLQSAKLVVDLHLVSFPEAIKTLGLFFFNKYIKLLLEKHRHENNKLKLSEDEFIPTTLKSKFALGSSARVQEHASDRFASLSDEVVTTISTFNSDMRDALTKLANLELELLKAEIGELFCEGVSALITAFCVKRELHSMCIKHVIAHAFKHNHQKLFRCTPFMQSTCAPDPNDPHGLKQFAETIEKVNNHDSTYCASFDDEQRIALMDTIVQPDASSIVDLIDTILNLFSGGLPTLKLTSAVT